MEAEDLPKRADNLTDIWDNYYCLITVFMSDTSVKRMGVIIRSWVTIF